MDPARPEVSLDFRGAFAATRVLHRDAVGFTVSWAVGLNKASRPIPEASGSPEPHRCTCRGRQPPVTLFPR